MVLSLRSRAGAVAATWCEVHSWHKLVQNLCSDNLRSLNPSSIQHLFFCRFFFPKTCTITPGNVQSAACGFQHIFFCRNTLPQTRPISNVIASRPLISPAAPSTLGSQSNSLRLALRVLANSCSSVTDSLFQVRAALGSLESV